MKCFGVSTNLRKEGHRVHQNELLDICFGESRYDWYYLSMNVNEFRVFSIYDREDVLNLHFIKTFEDSKSISI